MLALLTLFGFLFWGETPHPNYPSACAEHVESKLSRYFKEKGFLVVAAGGSYRNCIRELDYYLVLRKAVDEEEALRIYLSLYPGAKKILNESKEIRFYLYEYPVTPSSLGVTVSFRDEYDKDYSAPYVAWITNYDDEIAIYYHDPQTGKRSAVKRIKCPELNAL